MKKPRNIFFFILLGGSLTSLSQDQKYSQKDVDDYRVKPLNKENLGAFKKMLQTDPQLIGWCRYYALRGYYHMATSNENDSAIFYAKKAIATYQNSKTKYAKEEENLVTAYFAMSRALYYKNEYQKSIISLFKCLELDKKYPSNNRAYFITTLAANHLALGNDSLAVHCYKTALKDTSYTKRPRALITTLTRVGVLYGYDYLGKIDSAKYYFHEALRHSKNLAYNNNLSAIYNNLGDLYKIEEKVDSATYYYTKSNDIFKSHKPLTDMASIETSLFNITNYSYVKIHSGKLNEAINDLNMVLDSLDYFGDKGKNIRDLFLSTVENLELAYQKKGNYKKVVDLLGRKATFLDQFHQKQLKQELEKLQVQYETKEKESEIQRLEILNQNQAIVQKQKDILMYSIVALLIIFLIGTAFFFYQKNINDKYKKVVLEQKLLRTQMDPHFLFNALNTIVILNEEQSDQVRDYTIRLSKLLRLILENSREEFVPLQKEIEALENYLALQSNFSRNFSYEIHIAEEIEPEYSLIPPMLVQPFVENSILHGIAPKKEQGKISISFRVKDENAIVCSITDNGMGYRQGMKTNISREKTHTSLSEKIVRERLDIYNKKLKTASFVDIQEVQDEKGQCSGTIVNIKLPTEII